MPWYFRKTNQTETKIRKTEEKATYLPLTSAHLASGPTQPIGGGQGRLLPPARRTPPTAVACTPSRHVLLAPLEIIFTLETLGGHPDPFPPSVVSLIFFLRPSEEPSTAELTGENQRGHRPRLA